MEEQEYHVIKYQFKFDDGKSFTTRVKIGLKTLVAVAKQMENAPEWTLLENEKCPHCPLKKEDFPHCPVAYNLQQSIEKFADCKSFENTDVYVHTPQRIYFKKTDLQTGLMSYFGLVMATSACPHFNFLRPLAVHHLPFSSVEETFLRLTSSFLLGHFFTDQQDINIRQILDKLNEKYNNLEILNQSMLNRIKPYVESDSGKNAFVGLNTFAQIFSLAFDSNLDSLAYLFKDFD